MKDRFAMRLGSMGEIGSEWIPTPTAAPRPAARDQRPRRGQARLPLRRDCFSLPASWPLLPLRDGRGFASFSCDCRSLFALLLAKGEEGTSMWGEHSEVAE